MPLNHVLVLDGGAGLALLIDGHETNIVNASACRSAKSAR